jgi:hypothetical protein
MRKSASTSANISENLFFFSQIPADLKTQITAEHQRKSASKSAKISENPSANPSAEVGSANKRISKVTTKK